MTSGLAVASQVASSTEDQAPSPMMSAAANPLKFEILGAEPVADAAVPLLAFSLRVTNARPEQPIHSVMLQSQIQIEVVRRRYGPAEQARLVELFGEPSRWGETLRTMLWTHAHVTVPALEESVTVALHVPCSFDFNVAATKYFYGLAEGEAPLAFLFSGTVFYAGDAGLQVGRVSWESEARFRLPVATWRALVDRYYPNTAWLCLRRDEFELLAEFKRRRGLATWEQVVERLLAPGEAGR